MGPGSKAKFAYDSIAERLKKANIYITGIGTQTHIENTHTGTPVNIRAFASKLKSIGMILQITELDIGFKLGAQVTAADYAAQGHLYRQFMDVFLESDNMEAFVIWGVSDKCSWLKDQEKFNGLIFDSSFAKKPAYDSLVVSLKAHDALSVVAAGSVNPIEWENGSATFGKATYVIVDYSAIGADKIGSWESDVANGAPVFDSESGLMKIPSPGVSKANPLAVTSMRSTRFLKRLSQRMSFPSAKIWS